MDAESKLRYLAQQDATLQAYFFTAGQIRWFDLQLQPNYLAPGRACARITRVSTLPYYSKETSERASIGALAWIRFQIDVLDYDSVRARAAAAAIVTWLTTVVDLSSTSLFDSPVTSPKRHPNFVLNQRAGLEPKTLNPVYLQMLDVRVLNLEED